jgi:hypothetical protein
MMLSILWALIPRDLYSGALMARSHLWLPTRETLRHAREAHGFTRGYAVAVDSAREATILRLTAVRDSAAKRADSLARAARIASAPLDSARAQFATTPRHTPRLEALTVPVTVDTSLVGVFVESTGEHFVLPRRAAMYWATSDSLVGYAQQLLKKYAAANAGWANAYTAEHEARLGADSLSSLWRQRALASEGKPMIVGTSNMHRIAYLALGAAVALVARNNVHIKH